MLIVFVGIVEVLHGYLPVSIHLKVEFVGAASGGNRKMTAVLGRVVEVRRDCPLEDLFFAVGRSVEFLRRFFDCFAILNDISLYSLTQEVAEKYLRPSIAVSLLAVRWTRGTSVRTSGPRPARDRLATGSQPARHRLATPMYRASSLWHRNALGVVMSAQSRCRLRLNRQRGRQLHYKADY